MLLSLTSLLLLGVVPPQSTVPPVRPLPGIETVSVSAPSPVKDHFLCPALSASGALLLDMESGEELMSIDADTRRPTASLAKIMTALLLIQGHEPSETVTIAPIAENIRGSTMNVKTGEHLSLKNMLFGLLLPSANDAAYALAIHDSRSTAAFVAKMNTRARALGLKNTHFANPAGLDSAEQYSTARDLAALARAALREPLFQTIVATRTAVVKSVEGSEFRLRNTNEMLHYNDHVLGVKTGTTDLAGECLIVLFNEGKRQYLLVLLGSRDRYADALSILRAVHEAS